MPVYPQLPSSNYGRQLRRRLLTWFRRDQRDLPWRRDRDPYHIWVSEIMLQQTQVTAVIPYYRRFLAAFPTLEALAAASEQQVLRVWEGLGYYRRARDLHRAARRVVKEHQGTIPKDPAKFAALPGIGCYTLGAILSQAFDRRLPIVEANSLRVLSRLFACEDDPRSGPAQRWLWRTAEKLLPRRGSGEFNQSIMELGALICTPRNPSCLLCPVTELCAARRRGLQNQLPRRTQVKRTTFIREVALVLCRGSKVLLVQRPGEGRWANLWEFPHGPLREEETELQAARRLIRELTGLRARLGRRLTTLTHGITRFRITVVCYEARHLGGRFRSAFYQRGRWITLKQLEMFPLSVPQRRLAALLP